MSFAWGQSLPSNHYRTSEYRRSLMAETRTFATGVEDVAQSAGEAAIKKVIAESGQAIAEEVGESVGKQVSEKAQKEALQKVLKEFPDGASDEVIQAAYKTALQETISETTQEIVDETTQQGLKNAMAKFSQKGLPKVALQLGGFGAGVWILNNATMGVVDNFTGGGGPLDSAACGDKMKEAYPDLSEDELQEKIDECVAEVGTRIAYLGLAAIGVGGLLAFSLITRIIPRRSGA